MASSVSRIVSLAPSNTEILFFLGLADGIIGVSEQCDYPREAGLIGKIGSFIAPDCQKIASLNPDLVLGYGKVHDRILGQLEKKGYRVVSVYPDSVESVLSDMEKIGILCRVIDAIEKVDFLRQRIAVIEHKLLGAERPRVLRLMGESSGSMHVPTKRAFQFDVIRIAGGEPMPVPGEEPYKTVPIDDIRRFDPEVVLCCGKKKDEKPQPRCKGCTWKRPVCQRDVEDVIGWDMWGDIAAVRNRRFYALPCGLSCRPGPRIVESIEAVARLLHPAISV